MAVISERRAWSIVEEFVGDCLLLDNGTLQAIVVIGSLGGGYYRPGQSDIDTVLIVKDGAEDIWGTPEAPNERLAELAQSYKKRYRVPKDFGAFVLPLANLHPPYTNPELVSEIARLKVQSKCVYGCFSPEHVKMPSREDFLQEAKSFEAWFDSDFGGDAAIRGMSGAACVNTILIHLKRFLHIERGIYEFNKQRVIPEYLQNEPPFDVPEIFSLIQANLAGQELSAAAIEKLRCTLPELRRRFNSRLGML